MSHGQPYGEPLYTLTHCTLRPIEGETEATWIGASLAGMDPWRTLSYPASALTQYLLRPDPALRRYAVLAPDGAVMGVIGVRYPWLRGPYLELFGLFEAYQGQGLGSELIEWFTDQARLAAANAWVIVSAFNHSAYRFYQRHGFAEVGVLNDLARPGYDERLLRKILAPPVLAGGG